MSQDRVVLVTGATSGIGAAVARALADSHTTLLLHGRGADTASRQAMERVRADVQAQGSRAEAVYLDLTQPGAGAQLVQQCLDHFGRLDQIVSNAGHASRTPLSEASLPDLMTSMQSMAGAFFELTQAARPALQDSNMGSIVLTSSFVAHRYRHDELFPITAAAKSAAESLAMSLAAELAPSGITVNCVVPGYTLKDPNRYPASDWQTRLPKPPLGRFGEPADVAGAVQFLLGPQARYITGQRLAIDGGLQLG